MSDNDFHLPWEHVGEAPVKPGKRVGLLVDPRRCVGCHACGVSCKTEHDVALGGFRIRTHYLQRPDRATHLFLPMMCMHCQDAPCIPACPNEAIVRGRDGRVEIDKDSCQGDTSCITACPYDAIHFDLHTQQADKCNLCTHRTDVGMLPACVEVCPTEALRYGDFDDLDSDVVRHADAGGAAPMRPEHETRPTILYVGLETWMADAARGVQLQDGENDIVYERGGPQR